LSRAKRVLNLTYILITSLSLLTSYLVSSALFDFDHVFKSVFSQTDHPDGQPSDSFTITVSSDCPGPGGDGTKNDDNIVGTDEDDDINGGNGNDNIQGCGGDDKLNGNNDDDTLDGGQGDDDVFGNNGDDTLTGGGKSNFQMSCDTY